MKLRGYQQFLRLPLLLGENHGPQLGAWCQGNGSLHLIWLSSAVISRVAGPWSLWGQAACQASAETAYRAVLPPA